jgi:metal-dependent amidase/aminoacylase/carboxypeptidase family protein
MQSLLACLLCMPCHMLSLFRQTLVSRETSPLGSAVLSVTLLRAGEAYNVIPSVASFGGTIRWVMHQLVTSLLLFHEITRGTA